MAVIGNLPKAKGKAARKVEVIEATGPSSDVSISAQSGADVVIPLSPSLPNPEYAALLEVSGLPGGVAVGNITFAGDFSSVTLHAVNATAGSVTVSANSVTVKVLVIGY